MSYLTNDKMSPELRERIEASLRGSRPAARRAPPSRVRLVVRLVTMTVIVGCVLLLGLRYRQGHSHLDTARQQLLAEHARLTAPASEQAPPRIGLTRDLLVAEAGVYLGDHVAPNLRREGALGRLAERGVLYVRGPVASLRGRGSLPAAIAESRRDAFVNCLFAPPSSTTEREMLPTVAASYRGRAPRVPVLRLQALFAVEPFLGDAWRTRLRAATSVAEVRDHRQEMERAELSRAAEAVRADLLVFVLDEPKKPGTHAELDGANDHMVRVGIFDLGANETLLRLRRRMEPSWISEARRVEFARGLNGCRLAVDVVGALTPVPVKTTDDLVQLAR
jgi:hypothetical protein